MHVKGNAMEHVWDWELGKLPRGNLSHPYRATMEPVANPLCERVPAVWLRVFWIASRRAARAVAMTRKDVDALRDFTFAWMVVILLLNGRRPGFVPDLSLALLG
jgi:hypothetical protein